jgi:hypothetical protein
LLKDGNREQARRLSALVFEGAAGAEISTKGSRNPIAANVPLTEHAGTSPKTIEHGRSLDGREGAQVLKNMEHSGTP